jgi:hypothetical protein
MIPQSAIDLWDRLAERKANFAHAIAQHDASMAREAIAEAMEASNVAESLRMEQRTGIPHCCCTNPPHPMNR